MNYQTSHRQRLDLPDIAESRIAVRNPGFGMVWMYIRVAGRLYRAKIRKTLPVREAPLREWPEIFDTRLSDPSPTFGDLITATEERHQHRAIWYPVEEYLRESDQRAIVLSGTHHGYDCFVRNAKRACEDPIARVDYTGPSPCTGNYIGGFELRYIDRDSRQSYTLDRLIEVRHVIERGAAMVPSAIGITYLIEMPYLREYPNLLEDR